MTSVGLELPDILHRVCVWVNKESKLGVIHVIEPCLRQSNSSGQYHKLIIVSYIQWFCARDFYLNITIYPCAVSV